VKVLDGGLCIGIEDKLRRCRVKMIISRNSDEFLVISENKIVDVYRTRTRMALLRFDQIHNIGCFIYQQIVKRQENK